MQVLKIHSLFPLQMISETNVSSPLIRTIDPTKVIVTGKRVRFSFVGISDIIYFDPNLTNPAAVIANYQQVRSTPSA